MWTTDFLHRLGFTETDLKAIYSHGWEEQRLAQQLKAILDEGHVDEAEIYDEFKSMYPYWFLSDDDSTEPERHFTAKTAAEFSDHKTEFVWFPYIVRREVNIMMCSGGGGKTFACCLIAADISTGRALPDDFKRFGQGEQVLIISAEDTGELLRERLIACNADLSKVFIIDCRDSEGLNFGSGHRIFKQTIEQYHPVLVIVDPLQAMIGEDADLNRTNQIRPIMQRLANIAKETNTAILLISHVNKRSQTENLNNSASGSTDFINASRSALYLMVDGKNKNSRLLIHSKTNYAKAGRTIRFTFNENGGIYWDGFSEVDRFTVEEANRKRKSPEELLEAKTYQKEVSDTLIRAVIDAASQTETRRFSYDEFRCQYGENIFGNLQPKRALDSVRNTLFQRGIVVETGKRVKVNGEAANGFTVSPIREAEITEDLFSDEENQDGE